MRIPIPQNKMKPQKEKLLKIDQFQGINIAVTSTQIQDNESPDMLNLTLDDMGALNKRYGYREVLSIGGGKINGLFQFNTVSEEYLLFAHGSKLYKWELDGTYTQIYDGIADTDIHGFYYNEKFYFQDGNKYLVFDGSTVSEVEGYVPTVSIGSLPEGGGTPYEQLNLLTNGFKTRFTGDGSAKIFQLPLTDLDSIPPIVYVDGVKKTLGTHYTVNYSLGKITFSTAPPATVDGVEITAYKTNAGDREQIEKCRINTFYGGAGDTRVFVSGNPDYPNRDYRSGLMDPTYFPANGYSDIGNGDEKITGYARQYSSLVVVKERSQYIRTETLPDEATETVYPVKRLNDVVGSVSFDQVQLIENYPAMVDKRGVYITQSTSVIDERNVALISAAVNKRSNLLSTQGILDSGSLEDFKTIDFEKKFMLFNKTTGIVWVYDYQFQKWFKWNNIYANCFLTKDGMLYFGDSRQGKIWRFSTNSDVYPYRDYDEPIESYWRSKSFDFGSPMHNKLINKLFYSIKPAAKTSTTLKVNTSRGLSWEVVEEQDTIRSFLYSLIEYGEMAYGGSSVFPIVSRTKLRAKKVGYLQLEFSNKEIDEGFGLLTIEILYRYMSEIK